MPIHARTVTFEDKLSAAIGLAIGLVLIGAGFWGHRKEAFEQAHWIETQGTVVDSVSRRERDSGTDEEETIYAPVIEFTAKGDRAQLIGPYESYRLSKGKQVVTRYDPAYPYEKARVVEPLEGLAVWAVWGMSGIVIVGSLSKVLPIQWFWKT